MSSMLALLCVGWVALAAAWSVHTPAPYALEDAELHFEQFIQKFEKNYADKNEKQARFQIFKENLGKINSLNEKSKHAVFGLTQFSDVSHEELKFGFLETNDLFFCTYENESAINYNDAPESWDWREHDAVTPVKSQGDCGSCYAFSAIGNIEGQYAIKHKELVRLSEQQILDCDFRNFGCLGGQMRVAFRSLIIISGVEAEAEYPYKAKRYKCAFDTNKVKVHVTDCRSYNITSQEKLKQLLYHNGPISIAIKGHALPHYTKGIIDDHVCNEGKISHGVLLVGYGSENGVPYWIVKNSWDTSFGENGYFRMQRGEGFQSCGMFNKFMATAIVA